MHSEKFDSIVLISLIAVTILILLLHSYSLNQSLIIDVNSPYVVNTVTDNTIKGGKSTANLTIHDDHIILNCEIVKSTYTWPFCEISFNFMLNKANKVLPPINLSSYSHVNVFAQYLGDNSAGMRFQLRSYNKAFSTLDTQESWKYNGIEYWPESNSYPIKIPMNSLQVATWWLNERAIPIEHSAPEFDQVIVLELATGLIIVPGSYQIKLEKIEFIGKYFTNKQIYFFIISIWLASALIGLRINLLRSKVKLQKALKRTQELKQLNRLLNVESQVLKNQAERDPLTGALNRSGIEAIFTKELEVLSLIFIDIDHFKPINDTFGHKIGDEILIEFVKLISDNCRSTDFLSRWGGEEFLLICPNTYLHEASELAESLRLLICDYEWLNHIKLTASFGVAQKANEAVHELIERADKALYTAKAKGRNRVVVSDKALIDSSINF